VLTGAFRSSHSPTIMPGSGRELACCTVDVEGALAGEDLEEKIDELVVEAVPEGAKVVLQVGRGNGWLARMLEEKRPGRIVYGVERPGRFDAPGDAAPSHSRSVSGLQELFELDFEREQLPLGARSVDCIVYRDSLGSLRDPLRTVEMQRALLSESGTVVCSVPNVQHHGTVTQLLRGTLQYGSSTRHEEATELEEANLSASVTRRARMRSDESSLLGSDQVRLYTVSTALQLLLDAGYAATKRDALETTVPGELLGAGAPLFEVLGVGPKDLERNLSVREMILTGERLSEIPQVSVPPITFVACVNDEAQLSANLMRSPCLREPTPHELLTFRGCSSAAEGLNAGIEKASGDLVVLVHQDVYLPMGWPQRLWHQWQLARGQGGEIGAAGVFGVKSRRVPFDAIGHVLHSDRMLYSGELPADVDGLDELLMVLPRSTPLRFDPSLGWHLYGTDLALEAHSRGLRVVVLDAPCHHNTLTARVPVLYRDSERVLARKWRTMLPIHTNLSSIGSWLVEEGEQTIRPAGEAGEDRPAERGGEPGMKGSGQAAGEQPGARVLVELVREMQSERATLCSDLERARLEVASMKASPFWRAREAVVGIRRWLNRPRSRPWSD
jgi:Glycosyltransferase like family/Methyltransferase domain